MTRLIFLILISVGIVSCSDQDIRPSNLNGVYEGTFTITDTEGSSSNQVELEFENGAFTGNSKVQLHPAVGKGAFKIKDGEIRFTNASFWTANFDWNLILDGEFELSKSGEQLTFTKTINQVTYQYKLQKSE